MDRNKLNCVVRTWHIIISIIITILIIFIIITIRSFPILPRLSIGPGAPPQNVTGYNTSSTSINVTWNEVPKDKQHGIISHYTVMYRNMTNVTYKSVTPISGKFLELEKLDEFTFYDIKVLAATNIGDGPASVPIKVQTDEDSK